MTSALRSVSSNCDPTPLTRWGPRLNRSQHIRPGDPRDTMMMGLYFALGIFLLIAVPNPSAHRSLIAFAAVEFRPRSGDVRTGFEIESERTGFLIGSALLVAIGVALIVLASAKQPERLAASAGA